MAGGFPHEQRDTLEAAAAVELSHIGRGTALLQTSAKVFERFLAPGNPGREWGGCLYCMFMMPVNKRFVHGVRIEKDRFR